jgi:recombinase
MDESLAWLAGLLEGEATFGWQKGYNRRYGFPYVDLSMTDEDIVQRASMAMGGKSVVWMCAPQKPNRKAMYRCRLVGSSAAGIMVAVLPFMGSRRSEKIRELLKRFRERPGREKRALVYNKTIFEKISPMAQSGTSMLEIARWLNENRIPTYVKGARGGLWSTQNVGRLVKASASWQC